MLNGIDVSASGQGGAFDWAAYRGRIQFAITKVSDGTSYQDPAAAHNIARMREEGIVAGGYHFLRAGLTGSQQAEWFLHCAQEAGLKAGDLVAFDCEDAGLGGEGYGQMNATAASFVSDFRRHHACYPIAYTEISMAPYLTSVAACPLWLADLSAPLTKSVGPWELVSIWQTGQRGVDTDVFNGDLGQLKRLAVQA